MNNIWLFLVAVFLGGQPKKAACPFRDGVMRKMAPRDFVLGVLESNLDVFGKDSLVLAVTDGRVSDLSTGPRPYYRCYITISRGSLKYVCWDMDSVLVQEGQLVKAGQVIGYSSKKRVSIYVSDYLNKIFTNPADYLDCMHQ
jgi:hypothetical protein